MQQSSSKGVVAVSLVPRVSGAKLGYCPAVGGSSVTLATFHQKPNFTLAMAEKGKPKYPAPLDKVGARPQVKSSRGDVAQFLTSAKAVAAQRARGVPGRLVFALDATMSRQPTWDLACHLQASMFDAAASVGGLDVQLVYFRGHDQARASRWVSNAGELKNLMTGMQCMGGLTQIGRVLDHAEREAAKAPLPSLVFVGDAMEEDIDRLCHKAGKLALRNTRAFMFLEGSDPTAERAFREIARLTGGVFLRFDRNSAQQLKDLLAAVATYSAGGRAALEKQGGESARRLLTDMNR